MPVVDLATFGEIERNARWAEARTHRPRSRTGTTLLIIGAVIFAGMLLLYPSYSDAVDGGDNSGTVFFIVFGIVGGLFVVGGAIFFFAPLHRHAAVVLATTWSVSQDSKGRTTRFYYVHLRTAARAFILNASDRLIEGLTYGDPVIAFSRWGQLDAIWPIVDIPRAEKPLIASAEPAPPPLPPVAAVDASVVHRPSPIKRPMRAYGGAIAWAVVAVFVLLLPWLTTTFGGDPDPVDSMEAYERRSRIISIVTTALGAGMMLIAVWRFVLARKKPITTKLITILDRRAIRIGTSVITTFDIVESDGTKSQLSADLGVPGPFGVPLVAYLFDGRVIATRPA